MKFNSKILIYEIKNYNKKSAFFLAKEIVNLKNIVITAGSTIKKIYSLLDNFKIQKKNFFLSDERIVPYDSDISNFKNLRKYRFLNKNNFYHFNIYEKFQKKNVDKFFKQIPKKIDLSVLTIGVDCHVASIFNIKNLKPNQKYFKLNEKNSRVSISINILKRSKKIIFLVKKIKIAKMLAHYYKKNLFIFKYLKKKKITFIFEKKTYEVFKRFLKY